MKDWNREIIICTKCGGSGKIFEHIGHGDYIDFECSICDGSGRLVKTTKIKYKPYKPEKD